VTAVRLASSVWLQPSTALPALISAANCTRSDISRSVDGARLPRFDMAGCSKRKPRRVEPPGFSISRPRSADRGHGRKLYWTRRSPAQIWVFATLNVPLTPPDTGGNTAVAPPSAVLLIDV